ncbi:Dihydrofolate reductase [Amycolatopsis arida]|uniref:Dihydrofolate reductase n=1 Tax=Amycolatopsis arida TaxID=587909 RepID=A0A1I5WXG1_9PSEU|nr:dihydrofolate reductase family protein [Amycolatopsis arida]TDX92499.1 dihydrofolate reductase [Amycolatopsis arida]SFQ24374.1 Dihydrofolate reductase [Amycolatopsis arida]
MRKVVLWMQVSVDGFVEGPNGEFDWPVVGEELHRHFLDEAGTMGTFLYGRKVYELMASFWPDPARFGASTEFDLRFSELWKPMPKVVLSTTLERADWNAEVVRGDVAKEVAKLRRRPGGDMVLFGGADIAGTFLREGLLDELRLFVHPVVLGGGTPLFPTPLDRIGLRLESARTFDSAVVALRYAPTRG